MSEKPPTGEKYNCKMTGWAQCPECGSAKLEIHIGDVPINYSGDAHPHAWFECISCGADSWSDIQSRRQRTKYRRIGEQKSSRRRSDIGSVKRSYAAVDGEQVDRYEGVREYHREGVRDLAALASMSPDDLHELALDLANGFRQERGVGSPLGTPVLHGRQVHYDFEKAESRIKDPDDGQILTTLESDKSQMAQSETSLALIRVIAFYLPAWAIMVQIFGRLMKEMNLDKNPRLIPLFGVGLTLAIVSFWLFDLTVMGSLVNPMISGVESGETSRKILQGELDLVKAQSAFIALGLIVLIIAAVEPVRKTSP